MPRPIEWTECEGCGVTIRKWSSGRKRKRLCLECAVQRSVDNANSISLRSGKYYDHWRQRMAEWAGNIDPG